MDADVIDIAISEGERAARRMFLRLDPTPADEQGIIAEAGARVEHALSECGFGATVIEEARAIMVDAYEVALARLKEGKAHA